MDNNEENIKNLNLLLDEMKFDTDLFRILFECGIDLNNGREEKQYNTYKKSFNIVGWIKNLLKYNKTK